MTPTEIKARFAAQGISVAEWAKRNNFSRSAVYHVLNGYTPKRGQMHEIAVRLGIKERPKPDPLITR